MAVDERNGLGGLVVREALVPQVGRDFGLVAFAGTIPHEALEELAARVVMDIPDRRSQEMAEDGKRRCPATEYSALLQSHTQHGSQIICESLVKQLKPNGVNRRRPMPVGGRACALCRHAMAV